MRECDCGKSSHTSNESRGQRPIQEAIISIANATCVKYVLRLSWATHPYMPNCTEGWYRGAAACCMSVAGSEATGVVLHSKEIIEGVA